VILCRETGQASALERQISIMSVTINIPSYLATFADGQRSVKLASSPANVSDALDALWKLHPGLRDRVVDEQNQVRQHINVFVGDESIRFAQGLATAVPDGAEILIVPAVSGG
jgi:molybdopterin synthase sulfur carrier subunit